MSGVNRGSTPELLQPSEVNETHFFLVHALVSSSQRRSRLLNIHRLLSGVVRAAKTVVKGTESQRKFNTEFAQFCRSALVGLGDLEDAAFELKNPGRRAADAADEEVAGIAEMDFIKEVAAFLASQTQALKAPYLEHVATSAVGTVLKQQQEAAAKAAQSRKRTRSAAGSGSVAAGVAGGPLAGVAGRQGGRTGTSETLDGLEGQELGLLDEREIVERAALLRDRGGNSVGRSDGIPSPLSIAHLLEQQQSRAHGRRGGGAAVELAEGVFRSGDGHNYDLRKENQKLTGIEELRLRLEPWKITQPYSTVELERVTVEKEKRTVPSKEHTAHSNHPSAHATTDRGAEEGYLPLLDVCLAQTPAELLRGWETREAALAAAAATTAGSQSHSPQFTSQPNKRGRRHGGRSPEQAPSHAGQRSPPQRHAVAIPPSSAQALPATGAEGEQGVGQPRRAFFPSLGVKANVAVPTSVMRELVHNGVSSIEFLYNRVSTLHD